MNPGPPKMAPWSYLMGPGPMSPLPREALRSIHREIAQAKPLPRARSSGRFPDRGSLEPPPGSRSTEMPPGWLLLGGTNSGVSHRVQPRRLLLGGTNMDAPRVYPNRAPLRRDPGGRHPLRAPYGLAPRSLSLRNPHSSKLIGTCCWVATLGGGSLELPPSLASHRESP
jgi:hypothetical protein